MSMFRPRGGDTLTIAEPEDIDAQDVAAVPVPVLYSEAQAAMAGGAWLSACELLREVIRLEPGFSQDGRPARELLAQARRAHALATRRRRVVGPWPVVISAAALVFVPLAVGIGTAVLRRGGLSAPVVLEVVPPVPTVVAPLPTAGTVLQTVAPTAAPVALLPLARVATAIATVVPVVPPTVVMTPRVPTASELWQSRLVTLDAVWGTNWPAAIRVLDSYLGQYPGFTPARDKLYAALVEDGKELIQRGDTDAAAAQLRRARVIQPDRPDAGAVLESLTPVPSPAVPTPAPSAPAAFAPAAFSPAASAPAASGSAALGARASAASAPAAATPPTTPALAALEVPAAAAAASVAYASAASAPEVPAPAASALEVPAAAAPAQLVARAQEDCETYDNPDTPCALSDGAIVSGFIRVQGGRNYFWFGVPSPDMHVTIRLTDLAADYDLYLFSDQVEDPSQPIIRSVTPDTAPETIDAVLHDPGTYVIEVVDDPSIPNAPDVPYTLSFGLRTVPVAPTLEPTSLPTPAPTPTAMAAPALLSVPGVLGQSANNASRLLREAGLVVEVVTADAFSRSGPGTIATQDPQPAARVAPGSTVRLAIASGRVTIPNVRGRPEAEAYAVLRAAGFDIQTRRRPDDAVPSGQALGTNPGDGAILAAGSSVELLISQGH